MFRDYCIKFGKSSTAVNKTEFQKLKQDCRSIKLKRDDGNYSVFCLLEMGIPLNHLRIVSNNLFNLNELSTGKADLISSITGIDINEVVKMKQSANELLRIINIFGRKLRTKELKIISELTSKGFTVIDHRSVSDSIWVIHDRYKDVSQILSKYNYAFSWEAKGSVITNYKPAWKIIIKEK